MLAPVVPLGRQPEPHFEQFGTYPELRFVQVWCAERGELELSQRAPGLAAVAGLVAVVFVVVVARGCSKSYFPIASIRLGLSVVM